MLEPHESSPDRWRVLVLAPLPADAEALCRAVRSDGLTPQRCSDAADLCRRMHPDVAAAVICEEALDPDSADLVAGTLLEQPEWSDPPILVLGSRGPAHAEAWRRLQRAKASSHTLLFRRPITGRMLSAALHAAVGCRERQHHVRDELARREQIEAHLRLITAEMDHRVRNTLAMVESLARQSVHHAGTVDQFREIFEGRLRSFARAHGMLTSADWTGMTVREIVASELALRIPAHRFSTSGSPIRLPPRAALALHMAVHELATNAAKYGAASGESGRVDVSWSLSGPPDAPEVELRWREHGGPEVSPPSRAGFGTHLMTRLVDHELGGRVHADFAPGGLTCVLRFPLPGSPTGAAALRESPRLATAGAPR